MGKKFLSALTVLSLILGLLSSCSTEDVAATTESTSDPDVSITPVDDQYRNWYEVFVYSYADSNADGIGDFNGLADKLDYIAEMGFNGIWLMPIMESPSYHKYDVTNYYDVDPEYGTLEDFRNLLKKAHDLGIWVIIDLPVNHTSNLHPWFMDARSGPDAEYRDYYVWSDSVKGGYSPAGDYYYESQFVSTMPDLNLDNQQVRQQIQDIIQFWLTDVGVDGFRLDAVTSYYTGSVEKNVAFLTWLGQTARSFSPNCYIVGEAWTDLVSIGRYSEAEIDSFFTFSVSQQDGSIAKILGNAAKTPGQTYGEVITRIEETLSDHSIAAPFLNNHDTARAANFLGRSNVEKLKMAAGLLAMMPGNTFVYYGEEIGMIGKGDDPNKRIGMLWTTEAETTKNPPGTTESGYALPSVSEQEADETSLLNYYKTAMWLRLQYPQIARGSTEILPCDNTDLCVMRRTWNGSSVVIVVNPSSNEHTLTTDYALADTLCATDGTVTQDGGVLNLPAYSIAILQ